MCCELCTPQSNGPEKSVINEGVPFPPYKAVHELRIKNQPERTAGPPVEARGLGKQERSGFRHQDQDLAQYPGPPRISGKAPEDEGQGKDRPPPGIQRQTREEHPQGIQNRVPPSRNE